MLYFKDKIWETRIGKGKPTQRHEKNVCVGFLYFYQQFCTVVVDDDDKESWFTMTIKSFDNDDDEDDDDSQWQLNLWSSFDGSANARLGSRWKEAAIRIPTRCCHNSRNPQMWIRIVDYIWSELWIIFITILYNILLEF